MAECLEQVKPDGDVELDDCAQQELLETQTHLQTLEQKHERSSTAQNLLIQQQIEKAMHRLVRVTGRFNQALQIYAMGEGLKRCSANQ